jgi:hypothetical protein
MLVTLFGMVTLVRPVQPQKENPPMLATLLGMVIPVRLVQRLKALFSILVTLLGMVMPVRPTLPAKALLMAVTLSGMVKVPVFPFGYSIKAVLFLLYITPSCDEYALLAVVTFIAIRLVHSSKAETPILVVTLSGMVTLVRLVQPRKA